MLLDLDRARALVFHPSKTPAEYIGEARLDPGGRAAFAELVARLYRHVFGAVPVEPRDFDEFGAAARGVVRRVIPD